MFEIIYSKSPNEKEYIQHLYHAGGLFKKKFRVPKINFKLSIFNILKILIY